MTIARASVLEEMASGIAHELNQPLGAIVTFAQAGERMLNRPEPMVSGALEVLQLISREALGAGDGIRHMRRLFNRDTLNRSACAIEDVVRELSGVLELLALRTGGRLTVHVDQQLPLVSIDKLRIQHVLFTLVQNAFESSGANTGDGPLVQINLNADRYDVEVSVVDSGGGIAAEHRAQIFHPFFTTKPHGTGLGLASARAIVEAHEGAIGFENVEGQGVRRGTRFWFRIPTRQEE
jgi:signal transduction histidine kinase